MPRFAEAHAGITQLHARFIDACRTTLRRCWHIQLIVQPTIVEVTG